MPTDDCHMNYRDHLDNMQVDCAHGESLRVWEITIEDANGPYCEYAVAKDNASASKQATNYLKACDRGNQAISTKLVGFLMQSGDD